MGVGSLKMQVFLVDADALGFYTMSQVKRDQGMEGNRVVHYFLFLMKISLVRLHQGFRGVFFVSCRWTMTI